VQLSGLHARHLRKAFDAASVLSLCSAGAGSGRRKRRLNKELIGEHGRAALEQLFYIGALANVAF
jgi:hypothetical protein